VAPEQQVYPLVDSFAGDEIVDVRCGDFYVDADLGPDAK
jgi:hypothetical protein